MIIKVCGMRDPGNLKELDELRLVDWTGFIFYPKSPRAVDPATLRPTLQGAGKRAKRIGVFVNAGIDDALRMAEECGLSGIQLHGGESADDCHRCRREGYTVIKALPIGSAADIAAAADYDGAADYLLFDTRCAGYGGSGQSFDWSVLNAYDGATPFLLSGGIRPESAEAIRRFSHPRWAGVDLNSGFELAPGIKDIQSIKNFIKTIKQ